MVSLPYIAHIITVDPLLKIMHALESMDSKNETSNSPAHVNIVKKHAQNAPTPHAFFGRGGALLFFFILFFFLLFIL